MFENLSQAEYDELRSLILGLEPGELQKLWRWLKDPDSFAEEISDLIPVSIKQMISNGVISTDSLLSLVEEAIERSVTENPKKLANALYPIMMPAIRKAVAEDLKKMIESVNGTLEKSFSVKRLGWRFQAALSGRSYTEIILSQAYIYRVRQVFLIHRRTGLMLQHAVDEKGEFKDPDMVSAMLTAIKDFVKDSFDMEGESEIETIEVGNYTLWIEQGPYAILAGIVEGNPPDELREIFKQALENIHLDFNRQLNRFDGDVTPFEEDTRHISLCLQKQAKAKKKRPPYILLFLLIVILAALGYWIYTGIEQNRRWDNYIEKIKSRPGIIVTESGKQDGTRYVRGLRDPMAENPVGFLSLYNFDSNNIISNWSYYYSLDSAFVLKRLIKNLNPPDSVEISFKNGILYIQGEADPNWEKRLIEGDNPQWGIDNINTGGLNVDTEKRLQDLIDSIESKHFVFPFSVTDLNQKQKELFKDLYHELDELVILAGDKYKVKLHINGHTTSIGNVEGNKEMIDKRARYFESLLQQKGFDPALLETNIHIYDNDKLMDDYNPRSVTFDVELNQKQNDDD